MKKFFNGHFFDKFEIGSGDGKLLIDVISLELRVCSLSFVVYRLSFVVRICSQRVTTNNKQQTFPIRSLSAYHFLPYPIQLLNYR